MFTSFSTGILVEPEVSSNILEITSSTLDDLDETVSEIVQIQSELPLEQRLRYGFKTAKENIKYKSEDDLNSSGKILTPQEQITKKLYEIYNNFK